MCVGFVLKVEGKIYCLYVNEAGSYYLSCLAFACSV